VAELPPLSAVRPEWWDDAACRGQGPAAWVATLRGKVWPEGAAVCAVCLVQPACLGAGWDEVYTVHAGTAWPERDRMRSAGITPERCAGGCGVLVVPINGQYLCGASGCPGVRRLAA